MSQASKLRILERRLGHLREKVELRAGSASSLNYMEGEIEALAWALPALAAMIEVEKATPVDVVKQQNMAGWQSCARSAMAVLEKRLPDWWEKIVAELPEAVGDTLKRDSERRRFGALIPRADDTRPVKR